jgi:hypothetical protein
MSCPVGGPIQMGCQAAVAVEILGSLEAYSHILVWYSACLTGIGGSMRI